tara:strand:- start:415 stop:579 length:165 start_codon:yes stop_codon:yes gene_type:complete
MADPALPGEPGKKGCGGKGRPLLPGEKCGSVEVAFNKTDSDTSRRTKEKNTYTA